MMDVLKTSERLIRKCDKFKDDAEKMKYLELARSAIQKRTEFHQRFITTIEKDMSREYEKIQNEQRARNDEMIRIALHNEPIEQAERDLATCIRLEQKIINRSN